MMNREELEKSLKIAKTERKRNKKTVRAWDETIGSIKQQLKELPKLEVGKWYKFNNCLFNYQLNSDVYGFMNSKWVVLLWSWTANDTRPIPATDKEVEEALIKEAKKRDYKKGNFNYLDSKCLSRPYLDGFWFDGKGLRGGSSKNSPQYLFKDGKWAEIIEPKTISLDGDYTSEQLKVYIKDLEK